jgi:serine-type D-Ala-D-Ala carboxypeptidase (penicillin-binding protein 5/6)
VSHTPFLPPEHGRRGGASGNRRRRLALGAAITVPLVLALALAVAATNIVTGTQTRPHHASRRTARSPARAPHPAPVPAPTLSPAGLRLGRQRFHLTGIATGAPDIVAMPFHSPPRAGLLFNLASGRVLWQREAAARLPIASLTKMMTALVAVHSAPPDARVRVTREAIASDGSKVGVLPLGRLVPFETMLYGLMLPSGNDAAIALAQFISGTVPRFVARMNIEAAKLGLGCTRYASPSGYVDQKNFSCVADLAELAHLDLAQPRIARIVRSSSAILPFPIKGGKLYLYNNNPLLRYGYPGTTGLKTGYTLASGRCLVATAERHGVRLGVVLLNSPNPATQAARLLDLAFSRIYHQRPLAEPQIPRHA